MSKNLNHIPASFLAGLATGSVTAIGTDMIVNRFNIEANNLSEYGIDMAIGLPFLIILAKFVPFFKSNTVASLKGVAAYLLAYPIAHNIVEPIFQNTIAA